MTHQHNETVTSCAAHSHRPANLYKTRPALSRVSCALLACFVDVCIFVRAGGHLQSVSRSLRCVSTSAARAFLVGKSDRGVCCHIRVDGEANAVARRMLERLSENEALDEADVAFRSVVPKASKKRGRE